jgi:hypothetical protein
MPDLKIMCKALAGILPRFETWVLQYRFVEAEHAENDGVVFQWNVYVLEQLLAYRPI